MCVLVSAAPVTLNILTRCIVDCILLLFILKQLLYFGKTVKADFRQKRAPLSSLPSTFFFLALLCYLLPIGLTLVHCSLAFCQAWFLTLASSPLSFSPLLLLCCHAVSPIPHSCLSPFAISSSVVGFKLR